MGEGRGGAGGKSGGGPDTTLILRFCGGHFTKGNIGIFLEQFQKISTFGWGLCYLIPVNKRGCVQCWPWIKHRDKLHNSIRLRLKVETLGSTASHYRYRKIRNFFLHINFPYLSSFHGS